MLFRKKSRFLILFSFYRKKRRLVSLRMRPPEAVEAADRAMRRRGRAAQETRRSAGNCEVCTISTGNIYAQQIKMYNMLFFRPKVRFIHLVR